ncbi:MAG: site-specific DNA-methyltransferase [Acidimicrobiia bacterium]|nr:site-specific DNA-methyltransferase [Acidimicrobiia bacterium]
MTEVNRLYYGDNLAVLRNEEWFPSETIDLCYIDPPFNSKQAYNIIYSTPERKDRAQAEAFTDMWTWDGAAKFDYDAILGNEGQRYTSEVIELVRALKGILDESGMMAYLVHMIQRAVEIRRCLKPTGSFYLHCDPTASHYLKLALDAVFGPSQFRNEIIWRRTGSHNSGRKFGPIHDTVLFYTRSKEYTFNKVFRPYLKGHADGYFKQEDERGRYWGNALTGAGIRRGASGKPWRGYNPTDHNRHWAIPGEILDDLGFDDTNATSQDKLDALDAAGYVIFPSDDDSDAMPTYRQYLHRSPGIRLQDIWAYQPHTRGVLYGSDEAIDEDCRWMVAHGDAERIGYQTQKPEGLLDRIIRASSNEGDMVLDAYCGCGTTLRSANRLKRQWKGIDITYTAIAEVLKHFETVEGITIEGIPRDYESAVALATRKDDRTRKEFEKWAVLTYMDGRASVHEKKGADKGIDGMGYFAADSNKTEKVVLQVKSGVVSREHIATLRGDMERTEAALGVFITLKNPTKGMQAEANASGVYTHPMSGKQYGRIAIVPVQKMIESRLRFPLPATASVLRQRKRRESSEWQSTMDLQDAD